MTAAGRAEDHVVAEGVVASHGLGALRTVVLRAVSFRIAHGERVAVTGPSGSGKTTLLSLVGGLDRPEAGTLRIDGKDLRSATDAALEAHRREHVGFVFQAFHLLPALNALENVEVGLEPLPLSRRERRRMAEDALARVGLAEKRGRSPHELSGGEQQRVAVARAWAKDPPLLLADEPTGNLDEASGARVLDLLFGERGAAPARTLLVATHDPRVAERADRVLRLAGPPPSLEGTAAP